MEEGGATWKTLGTSLLTNVGSHQLPFTSDLPLMGVTSCWLILNFLSTSADLGPPGSHWLSSPGRRGLLSRRPFSSMQTFSFFTSSSVESLVNLVFLLEFPVRSSSSLPLFSRLLMMLLWWNGSRLKIRLRFIATMLGVEPPSPGAEVGVEAFP